METPKNTFYLTLGEAAKQTGKSKSVLSKAIATGKMSVAGKDGSSYKIDPAELFRVFPPRTAENRSQEQWETPVRTLENGDKIKELELKLELYQERLREKEESIREVKQERDSWRQQAERLLLTHSPEPQGRRSFWKSLFSKK